ncbi:hypothetical protein PMI14_06066 [Acidovorax sp. CF316]|nr:hypothetical protein PMI14_06066 [Acidovorax sp. CF316]
MQEMREGGARPRGSDAAQGSAPAANQQFCAMAPWRRAAGGLAIRAGPAHLRSNGCRNRQPQAGGSHTSTERLTNMATVRQQATMVVGKPKAAPSVSQQHEQGVLSRHANPDRTRERIVLKRDPATFTAAVAGTVQQLATPTEAQALTVILPDSASMTLESKDIGFVSPGQELETLPSHAMAR